MQEFKGFTLLSGGVDSSTVLAYAIRDCGRHNTTAFSIRYGQRHSKEIDYAAKVATYMSVAHEIVDYPLMQKGGLTDQNMQVPNASYSDLKGVSPTYVPFRNGTFLSIMAGIAASRVEAVNKASKALAASLGELDQWTGMKGRVYFGAHAEDAAGDAYPDCRLDFVGAMGAAIHIGTYGLVEVAAPIIQMYKDEIVLAGTKMGVPWHLTWSCYKGEMLHCGTCPTCRARKAGFEKAGVKDPTLYADAA